MSDWRTSVVSHFVPGVKPVTAVADPDQIMREPGILSMVESKGFTVVFFEDPIAFRLDYEERFRCRWQSGELVEVVVVFDHRELDFEVLPVDVLERARQVRLHLKDIFPRLSYNVLRALETTHFDALFMAHQSHASQPLNEAMTKDFVLRHLFEVDGSLISSDAELIRFLCRLHYRRLSLPDVLAAHLQAVLKARFHEWPLELLLRNRAAFWAFLQERWPIFIRSTGGGRYMVEDPSAKMRYPGPELLPFGHDDVRVFIDNLFEDGILTPIPWAWEDAADQTWIRVGLIGKGEQNTDLRFQEILPELSASIPTALAAPSDWLNFALRWGQAQMLWHEASAGLKQEEGEKFCATAGQVTVAFNQWLTETYPRIYNYPPTTPVMVHHIPPYLARLLEKGDAERVAFILVDGLAIEQWFAIKAAMAQHLGSPLIQESALFAWLPSITPVSRQAAFSGKLPLYFAESILETGKDEARWRQFWSDRGLHPAEVGFLAMRGEVGDEKKLEEWISPDTKALAVTLYKVDEIMHGMQLGAAGMLNQVRMWAEGGALLGILELLLSRGFSVVIAADHGNTEASGIGAPKQGVLCDVRGERCRIFNEMKFAEECVTHAPGSIVWQHAGLPAQFIPVIAPPGAAFIQQGTKSVCHGGNSIEELAVPFILVHKSGGIA